MIQPWVKVSSRPAGEFRIFTIRSDRKRSPRTGHDHNFFVIDTVNWVNVLALTAENRLIMVEQFRHGTNTVELEIPGGMMDPEETCPLATGERELREETGYAGENPQIIGQVFPNPAIMSNTCFTVLLRNCVLKHPTIFDQSEDLVTRLVAIEAIADLVAAGHIRHSLVIAAFYHFQLWQQRNRVA